VKMRRILCVLVAGIALIYSCKNTGNPHISKDQAVQNKILQQKDGTISLKVDKADLYQDKIDPSTNTAEWSVVVSKSGRFDVWMSSATRDTTDLKYNNSVRLSVLDKRIEAHPGCDKIIHNSSEVSYPYFRADSFIGSLYIQDTGIYNFQIISEKIIPKNVIKDKTADSENSKLLSVFLTPIR
jgi:hypothetical protein